MTTLILLALYAALVVWVIYFLNDQAEKAEAYKKQTKLWIEQAMAERFYATKLNLDETLKKLETNILAAHDQADTAKSKAEVAENLAHKVAMDIARHPFHSTQSFQPLRVEPIKIIIYDKRNLKKTTNPVKPLTTEQKVIKETRARLQKNN